MRIRILLAGLVTSILLAAAPAADASAPACRTAEAGEAGASNIVDGFGVYSGTVTTAPDGPLGEPATTSSGTLSGRITLEADACKSIDYTVVAVHDEPGLLGQPVNDPAPVELARTSAAMPKGSDKATVPFSLNIPEHPTSCVQFYVFTSVGGTVIDRAPDGEAEFNSTCVEDGGTPGGQFWN
jgi:hypothetical protein